jgi:hypothetical protein
MGDADPVGVDGVVGDGNPQMELGKALPHRSIDPSSERRFDAEAR